MIPPLETLATVSRGIASPCSLETGVQCSEASRAIDRRANRSSARPRSARRLLQRRPDLLAATRSSTPPTLAGNRPAGVVPALFSAPCSVQEHRSQWHGAWPGAFHQCRGAAGDAIFNAGRTRAINDIAESGQRETVLPLRRRDRACIGRRRECTRRARRPGGTSGHN